ncbi:hypothetical protein GCM10023205_41790 [Yinghuangia aomiensis]|uniref:Uncharacterized protein n=1 Tax=Yinghuangia aomiensis TaxID=676205 RepID=A0ABP9HJ36_9ACTN
MGETSRRRYPAGPATGTVRDLHAAFRMAGFELPGIEPRLLADGSVGVDVGPVSLNVAARLADWIRERA